MLKENEENRFNRLVEYFVKLGYSTVKSETGDVKLVTKDSRPDLIIRRNLMKEKKNV